MLQFLVNILQSRAAISYKIYIHTYQKPYRIYIHTRNPTEYNIHTRIHIEYIQTKQKPYRIYTYIPGLFL